jgi:hypothetical protein
MNNINELRKKEAAIKKILDSGVREKLMKIPGVTHVSVGLKEKGNNVNCDLSFFSFTYTRLLNSSVAGRKKGTR